MNCYNIQNSRLQLKYSTIPGVTPTIPTSNDHTDGTWNPTDIYISELFFNVADNTLFTRSASGIIPITSGTTSIDVTAFVNLTGGTMSGGLFTPYLSATTASATTIYSPHFEGVFYGDGSNLTGITATIFTGGTVSGNTTFTGNVDMCAANLTVQNIDTCGGAINITSDLLVNGGITATTFSGDGSGLTNITATNDTYVTGGTYTNGTATFTNNSGGTFNVSGFTTGQTLEQTLVIGNETGNNWINSADGYGMQFIDGTLEHKLGFHSNYVSMLARDTATSKLGFVQATSDTGEVEINSSDLSTAESTSISLLPDEIIIGATSGSSDYSTTMTTNQYESILRSTNTTGNLKYGEVRTYTTPTVGSASVQASDNVNNQISQVVVDLYVGVPRIFSSVSDGVTSKVSGIQQFADEIIVNGDISSFAGVEYFNDYSANYSNRSLVDKQYVDTKIASSSNPFTGGTVTGATNFTGGLSASTISATTISAGTIYVASMPELPFADGTTLDTYISGGNTFLRLRDNVAAPSGGTRTFSGNTRMLGSLTASTVSATTYYGDGSNLTGIISGGVFTGGTVTGATYFTGGLSATTYYGDGSNLTGIAATATQFAVNCRNQSGVNMYKGQVVYISGSTGNKPTIRLAQANSEMTSARTFGVLKTDIPNNSDGDVVTIGAIQTLDTRSAAPNPFTTDTLVDGDTLYLSPTNAGYVTRVKPYAPNHLVYIGKVIRTSPTNGYIEYQIQNGYELDELHDVKITGVTNGDLIVYNSGTTLWENTKTLNGNYTINGSLSVPTISATSVSASTIYVTNMPELPFVDNVTIDSYTSAGDTFIRLKDNVAAPSGGTRTFTGNVNVTSGLTSNTMSATTYQNLPYIETSKIPAYRGNVNTQKAYKLIRSITSFSMGTQTINGEAMYVTLFQCNPGELINEIAFRVNSAGAAGLGLAECRVLIYRSTLNANGEICGGALELDTNVNVSTLTVGLKAVSGLNHTLSSNTYKNFWYIAIRNYQTGSLSLKYFANSDVKCDYSTLSTSTSEFRDMSWYFQVPWTAATPASLPQVSGSGSISPSYMLEFSQIPAIGYSSY